MIEFQPAGSKEGYSLDAQPSISFLDKFLPPGVLRPEVIAVPTLVELGEDGEPRFRAYTFAVPVKIPSERLPELLAKTSEGALFRDRPRVVGVHLNPRLHYEAAPVACTNFLGEREEDIRRQVGSEWLLERRMDGEGVLIAVVDSGFHISHVREHHQWVKFEQDLSLAIRQAISVANQGPRPGEAKIVSHGTMSAFLATIAAPKATLIDISSLGQPIEARCQAALEAYEALAGHMEKEQLLARYRGVVVTNSWQTSNIGPGSVQLAKCAADGRPQGSGVVSVDQPCHLINRAIDALNAAGADIVFAAGNSGKCIPPVSGPGKIFGPNSHPNVLTVAAIDLEHRRLGNSSYGPGTQYDRKPDLSGYSNFDVSETGKDRDTSAATAVVAGIVAALRSGLGPPGRKLNPGPQPADLRQMLRDAAWRNRLVRADGALVSLTGFDREFGWGAVHVRGLRIQPTPLVTAQ